MLQTVDENTAAPPQSQPENGDGLRQRKDQQHHRNLSSDSAVIKQWAAEQKAAKRKVESIKDGLSDVKQALYQLQNDVGQVVGALAEVEHQLQSLTGEDQVKDSANGGHTKPGEDGDKRSLNKQQGKVFKVRESLLTTMLETNDIKTVYNMFVALLLISTASMGIQHVLRNDWTWKSGVSVIAYAFGKSHIVLQTWAAMFIYAVLSFAWMPLLKTLSVHSMVPVCFIYGTFQCILMFWAGRQSLSNDLPPASGFIVMMEAARFAMKVHSFFRFMLSRLIQPGDDHSQTVFSTQNTIQQYFYFLFAPTLLYRPQYPRSRGAIKWGRVLTLFIEVLCIVMYMSVIFEQYCIPLFKNTGRNPDSLRTLVSSLFNSFLPGTMVFIFGFFGLLHCWMNLFAELLRFGDRLTYLDWWNSQSFGQFFRLWNLPVHEFLYTYVYLDFCRLLGAMGLSKSAAKNIGSLLVIEFSAVVHEYIICCASGFFFPALAFLFGGPGLIFMFMNQSQEKSSRHNVFFWAMMIMGNGLLVMLYSREYFARLFKFGGESVCGQGVNGVQFGSWEYWIRFMSVYSFTNPVESGGK